MPRRWIGGGKCTCAYMSSRNGPPEPCPSCQWSIDHEEEIRESPEADPDYEVEVERAERDYEKYLDRLAGG